MAENQHVAGGQGETATGEAKRQAKAIWNNIKTPAAFEALTAAQQREIIRKVLVWLLRSELGLDGS